MGARESVSHLDDHSERNGAPAPWQSGYWWRRRHLHVPVIVWIVASVLGGAAIGNVLEPDGTGEKPKTTVVTDAEPTDVDDAEPAAAVICNENYAACVPVATDVDCAPVEGGTSAAGGASRADADGPSYLSEPVAVLGDDVYDLDTDHDGIGCD
jgi:hypothetical protein